MLFIWMVGGVKILFFMLFVKKERDFQDEINGILLHHIKLYSEMADVIDLYFLLEVSKKETFAVE